MTIRCPQAITWALILLGCCAESSAQITIETVPVGNAGNPNDPRTGQGSVPYEYAIGKYEVTISQYTSFLNAVAATDTYGLFNPSMTTDVYVAGISRAGSSGSYTYSIIGDGNRPISYVSWYDAIRFVNWLENGQPSGLQDASTTEDGAYTLSLGGSAISRNPGADWVLPSENEWYKAAYYDPSSNGPASGYWLYPTRSDNLPGNSIGSSQNNSNFYDGDFALTQSPNWESRNYLTPVGAFTGSASAYGTFDQAGNLWEWNETLIGASHRGLRGNSWNAPPPGDYDFQASTWRGAYGTLNENGANGFRVALVPEPAPGILCYVLGGLILSRRHRRANR